jgi:two-component sensor histidine kinase
MERRLFSSGAEQTFIDQVRAPLAHFEDLIGFRIAVDGPTRTLNAAAAQAPALHELATNAGKYGAGATHTGRVDVTWQLDGKTLSMSGWSATDRPCGDSAIWSDSMVKRTVDSA